ncbi:MAG TPA: sigma-70 family RNA polymerase sigma factor [Afifellaceae bacterium]|nr:sigma-70 family RNA polymerase sigma factor [Afifellaceae bacterium]
MLADQAMARAIAAGDQAAFAALVDRETPRLLRFARSLVGDGTEAEDVVQEAFLALWRAADGWRPEALLTTWLHRVCYTRSIDWLRRGRAFADLEELEDRPDPQGSQPDSAIAARERAQSLQQAMARLPPRQRTAVALFHLQEFPQKEAAAVMGVSEDALESLLARGRRRLRQMLSE